MNVASVFLLLPRRAALPQWPHCWSTQTRHWQHATHPQSHPWNYTHKHRHTQNVSMQWKNPVFACSWQYYLHNSYHIQFMHGTIVVESPKQTFLLNKFCPCWVNSCTGLPNDALFPCVSGAWHKHSSLSLHHIFFFQSSISISSSSSPSPRYSVTPFLHLQLTAVAVGTGRENLDSSHSSETTPNP